MRLDLKLCAGTAVTSYLAPAEASALKRCEAAGSAAAMFTEFPFNTFPQGGGFCFSNCSSEKTPPPHTITLGLQRKRPTFCFLDILTKKVNLRITPTAPVETAQRSCWAGRGAEAPPGSCVHSCSGLFSSLLPPVTNCQGRPGRPACVSVDMLTGPPGPSPAL